MLSSVIWIVYQVYLWPMVFSPLRRFPTPPNQKWWKFGFETVEPPQVLKWSQEMEHNGFIRYYGFLNVEKIAILSGEALRDAVTKLSSVQRAPDTIKELVMGQTNLVTNYGERHKISRKRVQPAFNAPNTKELFPLYWKKGVELASILNQNSDPVNISQWFNRLSLDVIGLGGFNADFNSISNPEGALVKSYASMFSSPRIKTMMKLCTIFPSWRWLHYRSNPDLVQASRTFRANAERLLSQRQQEMKDGRPDIKYTRDIIDLALRDGTSTKEELIDYCMTFVFAGHETTSTALTWSIYYLSRMPEVQARIRRDIRAVIPSPTTNESITPSHIDQVPSLISFINESLRYHVPVNDIIRQTKSDVDIGGELIPAYSLVVIAARSSNRRPDNWPGSRISATEFDPWRFLSSSDPNDPDVRLTSGGAKSIFSNMTFSHGPKNCIGERFARAEMAVVLAILIGKFEIVFAGAGRPGQMDLEKAGRNIVIVDVIIGGLWVRFKEVEGW